MKTFTDFSTNEEANKKFVWPLEFYIISIGGYDGKVVKAHKMTITETEAEDAKESGESLQDAIKYLVEEELAGFEQGFGSAIAVPAEQKDILIAALNKA
mgnify:CR=1 FL=1